MKTEKRFKRSRKNNEPNQQPGEVLMNSNCEKKLFQARDPNRENEQKCKVKRQPASSGKWGGRLISNREAGQEVD